MKGKTSMGFLRGFSWFTQTVQQALRIRTQSAYHGTISARPKRREKIRAIAAPRLAPCARKRVKRNRSAKKIFLRIFDRIRHIAAQTKLSECGQ